MQLKYIHKPLVRAVGRASETTDVSVSSIHLTKAMNNKRLDELKKHVKYGIALYVDPERQCLRTRPTQMPHNVLHATAARPCRYGYEPESAHHLSDSRNLHKPTA